MIHVFDIQLRKYRLSWPQKDPLLRVPTLKKLYPTYPDLILEDNHYPFRPLSLPLSPLHSTSLSLFLTISFLIPLLLSFTYLLPLPFFLSSISLFPSLFPSSSLYPLPFINQADSCIINLQSLFYFFLAGSKLMKIFFSTQLLFEKSLNEKIIGSNQKTFWAFI